jgi:sugar lactone lactonase YvrE
MWSAICATLVFIVLGAILFILYSSTTPTPTPPTPTPTPPTPTPTPPTPTSAPIPPAPLLEVCQVLTIAGSTAGESGSANGTSAEARFHRPVGVALGTDGASLFVADTYRHAIRAIDLSDGSVSTVAGSTAGESGYTDGTSAEARFNYSRGLALGAARPYLYIADTNNHAIRAISMSDGSVSTVAGSTAGELGFTNGTSTESRFNKPYDIALGAGGSVLYVSDEGNNAIRAVQLPEGQVSTVAGSTAGEPGFINGTSTDARFNHPKGLALGADGTSLFVANTYSHAIRAIDLSDGSVSAVAGSTAGELGFTNGTSNDARFKFPASLVLGADGSVLYVSDEGNNVIRAIDLSKGLVSTVAGSTAGDSGHEDGTSTDARFDRPMGLASRADGTLYVADYDNHAIRAIEFC